MDKPQIKLADVVHPCDSIATGVFSCSGSHTRHPATSSSGVVRNDTGVWVIGYSRHLGIYSVIEAELWGIYEGLLSAWSLGIHQLKVKSDCLETIILIQRVNGDHRGLYLIACIADILTRQ
ncbi:hypothetical protein GQ457_06G031650 [Hibiscus cannabinus]